MAGTLEQKIKALLEGKAEVIEEGTAEAAQALMAAAQGLQQAAQAMVSDDEDKGKGQDDDDADDQDNNNTATAKDKPGVNEEKDPFGNLDNQGSDEGKEAKDAKLKVGLKKKDAAPGKLESPPQSGKTDDNGDNVRLKSGLSKKESGGKLDGSSFSANSENDKNVDGTELQKGSKKGTIGEHMSALFNGEELSEEFQQKAQTIFEAAVEQVAEARIAALEEEYQERLNEDAEIVTQRLTEAVEEAKAELVEDIDDFLNEMVEQWAEDNALALEGAMKVELVNSFIDGMKGLFKEHYFEIPEDKISIVEEQAKKIAQLEESLAQLNEEHVSLESEKVQLTKASIQEQVSDELTEVEKEKFTSLAEHVEFTTEKEYLEKLETIKENYFPQGKGESKIPRNDSPIEITESVVTSKTNDAYVDSIAKSIRFK